MREGTYISSGVILPVLNMGMRGLGLVGRFGLSLYLAKYLSLSDVGLFGLITGITSMLPAMIGWGLNYFLNREIVEKPRVFSGKMVRDRLVVTLLSLAVVLVPATPVVLAWHALPNPAWVVIVLCIIVFECLAVDMHFALISVGLPLAANMLLFIRSAAWIFPVAVLGVLVPEFRTLGPVLASWLVGLLANFAALFWVLRAWPLKTIMATEIDRTWLRKTLRNGWLIYLTDVSICGTALLDRYVVDHFLGLRLTGIYTLYWSVANGIYVLVGAGVTQIVFPKLVAADNKGDRQEAQRLIRQTLFRIISAGGALSIIAALSFPPVLELIGRKEITVYAPVFWVMLAGICIRLTADTVAMDLVSRHLDRQWAIINILGVALAFTFSTAGIKAMGLMGAALAGIATYSLLGFIRLWTLKTVKPRARETRTEPAYSPPMETRHDL